MGATENREYYRSLNALMNPYSLRNLANEYLIGGAIAGVKNKFGIEFRISLNEMKNAFKWIEKYDKKYEKHISNPQSMLLKGKQDNERQYICDKKFVIKLDTGTFCYVDAGKSRSQRSNNYDNNSDNDMIPSSLFIYIFGRKMFKYSKELARTLTDNTKEYLTNYKVSGSGGSRFAGEQDSNKTYFEVIASDLHTRPMDTLFFNDDVKEEVVAHLDKFLSNEKVYKDRSLLYKTGILLYGDPGTGKSSLATAIATQYGWDVISVDMNSFNTLDVNALVESINADGFRYVVLMEDIDAVIKGRQNKDIDKEDDKNINKLLQFLDSSSSPTDVVFIATTNYVDTLDSALIRDGRFDIKLEVGELELDNIDEMCKSFDLTEDQIDDIRERIIKMGRSTINQSKLQNMILKVIEKQEQEDLETELKEEVKVEKELDTSNDCSSAE